MDSTVKYQLAFFYLVFFGLVLQLDARPSTKDKIGNKTTTLTDHNPLARTASMITESPLYELSRGTTDECRRDGGYCVAIGECPAGKSAAAGSLCGDGKTCCHTLPVTITNCRDRGGFCGSADECGRAPREPLGACPADHFCCLHVV